MKAAIEAKLGVRDPNGVDMLALTELDVFDAGIVSLTGLEYATFLTKLEISGNRGIDISCLSGLSNLEYLHMQGISIRDISPLSALTNLTWLSIDQNPISDISTLSGLTRLWYLSSQVTQISNISALSGLTNMTTVRLNNNQISDISALARLTKLTRLDLQYNPLNGDAYRIYLPQIQKNNPGIKLNYDPLRCTLTVSFTSGGTVTAPGAGAFMYNLGAVVPIRATADTNHHFVNWTGTAVSAGKVADPYSANTTVTVDADYTLQAIFAPRTLTISSSSGGTVTTPGQGAFQYDHGTSVPVVATPAANYRFMNWTGTAVDAGKVADPSAASTTVTVDADYTLEANFAIDQRTLTVSATGGGWQLDC